MKPNQCGAEMALFLVALTYSQVGSQVGLISYKARLLLGLDLGCPECHQLDERWVQFLSCAHEGRAGFPRGTQKWVGAKSSYISAKCLNIPKIQLRLWKTAVKLGAKIWEKHGHRTTFTSAYMMTITPPTLNGETTFNFCYWKFNTLFGH